MKNFPTARNYLFYITEIQLLKILHRITKNNFSKKNDAGFRILIMYYTLHNVR